MSAQVILRRSRRAGVPTVIMILLAATAWAHPKLVRSHPAPNASLTRSPTRVQVWFNEELTTSPSTGASTVQILDGKGPGCGCTVTGAAGVEMGVLTQAILVEVCWAAQPRGARRQA